MFELACQHVDWTDVWNRACGPIVDALWAPLHTALLVGAIFVPVTAVVITLVTIRLMARAR